MNRCNTAIHLRIDLPAVFPVHKEDTMITWEMQDARQLARDNPRTLAIPSPEERQSIVPGDNVKLIFTSADPEELVGERMCVMVESANDGRFSAYLDNVPNIKGLERGDLIEFEEKHIIAIAIAKDRLDRSEPYFKRCLVSPSVPKRARRRV
jgi:hypothetical protein